MSGIIGATREPVRDGITKMGEEMKVIPIDLENERYAIEIPADSGIDVHAVMQSLDEWLGSDAPFIILHGGMKLTRIDADDLQEET